MNLVPAEKPQDVYSEIATIVERKRREDAEQGVEIAQVNLGNIWTTFGIQDEITQN